MRYLAICLAVFGVMILGGCGGNLLQPTIIIPFDVSDFTTTGTTPPGLYHQDVDAQTDTTWTQYIGRISGYDGTRVTMHAVNADATPATMDVYISDDGGLSAAQVVISGKKLMTLNIPAGTSDINSDWQPLTEEAGAILQTAKFTVYAVGTPSSLNVTCTKVKIEGKFRVNVL